MARTSLVTSTDNSNRPSSGSLPRSAHTVGAGHFSEERIHKRKLENEKYYPDDEVVQSILSVSYQPSPPPLLPSPPSFKGTSFFS
jgi:hypothetical protein